MGGFVGLLCGWLCWSLPSSACLILSIFDSKTRGIATCQALVVGDNSDDMAFFPIEENHDVMAVAVAVAVAKSTLISIFLLIDCSKYYLPNNS